MSKHEHFKQLCALAALGEVPPAEAPELNRHLSSCRDCRQLYSEFLGLNASLVPLGEQGDESIIELHRESVRATVLDSITTIAQDPSPAANDPRRAEDHTSAISRGRNVAWIGAFAMACAISVFWLGTQYERRFAVNQPMEPARAQLVLPAASDIGSDTRIHTLEDRVAQADEALRAEKQRGDNLEQTTTATERQLVEAEKQRSAFEDRLASQAQELAATQAQLAAKTQDLKQKESAAATDLASIVGLQYQVRDLTEKMKSQSEALKREHDLLANGREIRDIIGARNLHIVDVYDTDQKGRTKKPFVRAFYTEGKSLVFYAYDLPQHPQVGAYVAWGQRNGNKTTIRNLGTLVNDDQGQKRWIFKFDDPNVLAEIDSVFITIEAAGDAMQPSGKRMLTAYLNDQVNHP